MFDKLQDIVELLTGKKDLESFCEEEGKTILKPKVKNNMRE